MAIEQSGAIGTGATTVYTSSGQTVITSMFFMNDNVAARTITIHIVKSGDTASTSNTIIKDLTIDPADTYVINMEKIVFDNGDMVQCTASVAGSVYPTVSTVQM